MAVQFDAGFTEETDECNRQVILHKIQHCMMIMIISLLPREVRWETALFLQWADRNNRGLFRFNWAVNLILVSITAASAPHTRLHQAIWIKWALLQRHRLQMDSQLARNLSALARAQQDCTSTFTSWLLVRLYQPRSYYVSCKFSSGLCCVEIGKLMTYFVLRRVGY